MSVWVIKVAVAVLLATVEVVVVAKVLLRAAAIIDVGVEGKVSVMGVLVGVVIIVVGVVEIVLKCVFLVLYPLGVSSGMDVELFMDGVTDVVLGVLSGIDIAVLADVNANAIAEVIITWGFPESTPLEEFSCCDAFDCRARDILDRGCVLQARMPSYHE